MSSFHEVPDDLWDYPTDLRLITTNGITDPRSGRLVMGGGVALQAKQRYPDLDRELGRLVRTNGNRVHILWEKKLIAFPTKEHFKNPSTLERIETSLQQLIALLTSRQEITIAMVFPGVGLGGLNREVVRPLLEKYLDGRFVIVGVVK